VRRKGVPGVRIPPSPPLFENADPVRIGVLLRMPVTIQLPILGKLKSIFPRAGFIKSVYPD
ncbi:MAG: hypothetical protein WCH86_09490, partial [Kiritimatiellales bacterium]